GQVDRRFRTSNTANSFAATTNDDWVDGWQLGAGLEHKITNDVSLGLEYLLTELEDDGYTVRAGGPVPATNPFVLTNPAGTNFQRTEDDLKIHAVRVTAAYR
ncbi:porin family protein, partial [Phenylobacterium hankyongense]